MPDPVVPAAAPVPVPAAIAPRPDPLRPAAGPAGSLAAAREKARAAAAAAPPAQASRPDPLSATAASVPPPPAAAPAPEPKRPEIDADAASLKTWARLQRENRELTAKLKDSEPTAAAAKALADARALYASGKRMDAIGILAGVKDPSSEMENLLADYLKGGEVKELTAAELAAKLEAEKAAERAEDEKRRKEDEEKQAAAGAAEAQRQAVGFIEHVIGEVASKFELCAKADHRQLAAAEALKGVMVLREARGIDPKDMTPEKTRALIEEALEEVEVELMLDAQREATRTQLRERIQRGTGQAGARPLDGNSSQRESAQSLGRRDQPETRQPAPPTIDATLSRPGVSPQPPQRFYTHAQAQERAREAARTLRG
jgi:hypothetical protein